MKNRAFFLAALAALGEEEGSLGRKTPSILAKTAGAIKKTPDEFTYAWISKTTASARFEGLCARYRPDVFRFALWLARDGAIAEDVVQETFLRAWRAIDSLADPEAARSWLLAIARREHARLYERKRHTTVPLDDLIANEDPALASVTSEDHSDIGAAISSLDTDYRKPLVLQALGYSTEDIARRMGLTRNTVLSRLYRARLKLRVALGTTDVADGTSAVRTIKATPQSCAA